MLLFYLGVIIYRYSLRCICSLYHKHRYFLFRVSINTVLTLCSPSPMATQGGGHLEPFQFIALSLFLSIYSHCYYFSPQPAFIFVPQRCLFQSCIPGSCHVCDSESIKYLCCLGESMYRRNSLQPETQKGRKLQIHHSPLAKTLGPVMDPGTQKALPCWSRRFFFWASGKS